ncbi:MAG: hypothetical protein AAGJ73_00725 [Pseudomonadota bacterium]
MTPYTFIKSALLGATALVASSIAFAQSEPSFGGGTSDPFGGRGRAADFDGAVFVMSNDVDQNSVVAYGRRDDGTLSLIGEFATGGQGSTDFDGPEGLDPLISGDAVVLSDDRRQLFVVNAGSNSVSAFQIGDDLRLRLTDTEFVNGIAPNSIAYRDGVIIVSSIDADGVFTGEPDQEGAIEAFSVARNGNLRSIRGSRRVLENRPSNVRFSPDGRFITVTSINAGSVLLNGGDTPELVVFGVDRNGVPTPSALAEASSTAFGNTDGRNLASAISHEIVEDDGRQFVVVSEAREFSSDGLPPTFPNLQAGSISSWELGEFGSLTPVSLDVLSGGGVLDGMRTTCWLEFSADGEEFWASNTVDSNISAFSFDEGVVEFVDIVADQQGEVSRTDGPLAFGTQSDGFIDMAASDNGEYLYQLLGLRGQVNVYKTEDDGSLSLIQTTPTGNLPTIDTQGIAAF